MQPSLRVFVDHRPRRPVVAVVGELDMGNVEFLDGETDELSGRIAAVDARYTAFIDAAGIAALVRLGDQRPLPVVASRPVERLIRICGLEDHLVPISAHPPRALDEAPFAVLEIGDDDSIVYANGVVLDHVGLPGDALASQRLSSVLALRGLRPGIDSARRSGGAAVASTLTRRLADDEVLCWTSWPLDGPSGSRAVVAIGAPAMTPETPGLAPPSLG